MISAAITNVGSILLAADGWGDGWHDGGPGPWFLLFPLFWVIVILGIVWIVRGRPPWRGAQAREPRPESGPEILERRFAEGEINADEYRERRSTLEDDRR